MIQKSKNILIVDDSVFDRELLKKGFSLKSDHTFFDAASGEDCLAILARQKIDLVIMDIVMPGLVGTSVLAEIRKTKNAVELPIIMVTSQSEDADVIACLKGGANDYIMKPVNFEIALSRMNTHLALSELSIEMANLSELSMLESLTTTYSHEINNPLTTAIASLKSFRGVDEKAFDRLERSLWRISDIVKKIAQLSEKKKLTYEQYFQKSKPIRLS